MRHRPVVPAGWLGGPLPHPRPHRPPPPGSPPPADAPAEMRGNPHGVRPRSGACRHTRFHRGRPDPFRPCTAEDGRVPDRGEAGRSPAPDPAAHDPQPHRAGRAARARRSPTGRTAKRATRSPIGSVRSRGNVRRALPQGPRLARALGGGRGVVAWAPADAGTYPAVGPPPARAGRTAPLARHRWDATHAGCRERTRWPRHPKRTGSRSAGSRLPPRRRQPPAGNGGGPAEARSRSLCRRTSAASAWPVCPSGGAHPAQTQGGAPHGDPRRTLAARGRCPRCADPRATGLQP